MFIVISGSIQTCMKHIQWSTLHVFLSLIHWMRVFFLNQFKAKAAAPRICRIFSLVSLGSTSCWLLWYFIVPFRVCVIPIPITVVRKNTQKFFVSVWGLNQSLTWFPLHGLWGFFSHSAESGNTVAIFVFVSSISRLCRFFS